MGLLSSLRFIVGVYQKSQKHLMLKSQISQSKYMFKVMIFLAVLGDLCGPTNIQTYHPWFPCTIRIDFYRRVSQKVCNTYKFTLSTRGSVFLFGGNYIRSFTFDSLINILQVYFLFTAFIIIRLVYQRFHERFKVVNMMGQQEFDLPKAVLDLVYTQTLCW